MPIAVPSNEHTPEMCQYLFKSGKNAELICSIKLQKTDPFGGFCKKHSVSKQCRDANPQLQTSSSAPPVSEPTTPQKKIQIEDDDDDTDTDDIPPGTEIITLPKPPPRTDDQEEDSDIEEGNEEDDDDYEMLADMCDQDECEDEDEIRRHSLILEQRYTDLPWLEARLPKKKLIKLPIDEQKAILDNVIKSYSGECVIKMGFNITTSTIENITNSFGYNLTGYNKALNPDTNPQIAELLHIITIRNSNLFEQVTPEWQLLGIMLMTAVTIVSTNQAQIKKPTTFRRKDESQNLSQINE